MAFKESFASSTSSFDNDTGDSSRATASLLFIEDRTTPDVNKYGSLTRTPYVVSASGTFTRTLFKTLDWQDVPSIPIYDMYINGQHFTFTLGAFVDYNIGYNDDGDPETREIPIVPGSGPRKDGDWDPNCGGIIGSGISGGCRRLYVIVPNGGVPGNPNTTDPNYCVVDPCCSGTVCNEAQCAKQKDDCITSCPVDLTESSCLADCNYTYQACVSSLPAADLNAAQRFDLNRDGATDVPGDNVQNDLRRRFAWQWNSVKANSVDINLEAGKNTTIDVDGDLQEEQILEMVDDQGRVYKPDDTANEGWSEPVRNKVKAPIVEVRVLDSQKGDLDLTYQGPTAQQPGLKDDMQMYTYTRDGTYLLIQEGKLYNPEIKTTVRSIQKRDMVDIIQRSVQLSNDTGRFCTPGTPSTPSPDNPEVEACNDCFNTDNVYKTCFDKNTLILYVRSRIEDRRGRKWITEIE